MTTPCVHCPWRVANHGKRTPWGFYTKTNLKRLWNQVRGGGQKQSCHPTDPSHPDHSAAGAKPGLTPQECAGSVILIVREFEKMKACSANGEVIDDGAVAKYLREHRDGLTKRGIMYWLVERYLMKDAPFFGSGALPDVDPTMEGIGR